MDKLSRFQLRLVDPRGVLTAVVSAGLGGMGLLAVLVLWLLQPELPALPAPDGLCCPEGDRTCTSSVLDRLPMPEQLRSVRARQAFAQRQGEPDPFPMPSQAERLSQIDYTEVLQLKLLGAEGTDVRWLVALLSERDWATLSAEPPGEILREHVVLDGELQPLEHARNLALAEAELEVVTLRALERRLRDGLDRSLAEHAHRVQLEGALLGPPIRAQQVRLEHARLALGGLSALLLLLAGRSGWKARQTVLVLTPSRICAAGMERPASWLEDFELYSHEIVLFGHDGTVWRLPPPPLPHLLELEDALRLLCQPNATAYEQERAQAGQVQRALAGLRRQNQSR